MTFFKANACVIFGGTSTEVELGKDRPTVFNDVHILDFTKLEFIDNFTANNKPTPRYGHCAASNLREVSEKGEESLMLVLGGLDFQYCPMDVYALTEVITNEQTKWEAVPAKKSEATGNTGDLESTVKLASKNILANRKTVT